MKVKKLIPLAFTSLLAVTGCAKQGYVASYSFQMGKDNGVHMNATMELTDLDFVHEEEVMGKEFRFSVDMKTAPKETLEGEGEESSIIDFDKMLELVYTYLGDGEAVVGYYKVGDIVEKTKHLLTIGFAFSQVLYDKIADTLDDDPNDDVVPDIPTIDPQVTEKLMYSTIDSKAVYLTIPVALDDLKFQLYWYGLDIVIGGSEIIDFKPVTEHDVGTHPTQADIDAINADETYKSEHPGVTYRDFHTLTISLLKNE